MSKKVLGGPLHDFPVLQIATTNSSSACDAVEQHCQVNLRSFAYNSGGQFTRLWRRDGAGSVGRGAPPYGVYLAILPMPLPSHLELMTDQLVCTLPSGSEVSAKDKPLKNYFS